MARPRIHPSLGTPLEGLAVLELAPDVAALDKLPIGSQVAGIYPAARERCDILEKDDDLRWSRGENWPTLASVDFTVFPVPVLRVGLDIPDRELVGGDPEAAGWHRGDWMQTYTGRKFYPMDPRAEDVDPRDIAHALGMLCRYNGHVDRFYSVAEHCVLLSYAVPDRLALWALMHDATEAYLGDMVRPLKVSQPGYVVAEDRVMVAIAKRFDLDITTSIGLNDEVIVHLPDEVKAADTRILLDEKLALMSRTKHPWFVDDLEPLGVKVEGWHPGTAGSKWLRRFRELTGDTASGLTR